MEIDLLFFICGILIGMASGLVPGIHSNTVVSVLSSLGMPSASLACAIIGLFPAHMLAAFVPSILFGVPEAGTVMSVLAGQRLVMRGEGMAALKAVILSCAFAAIVSCALFQPSLAAYAWIYSAIHDYVKWILLAFCIVLLARSPSPAKSLLVFLLSGALGTYSLNSGMQDVFLPLFSGMFAMGAILTYTKGTVPEQKDLPVKADILKWSLLGIVLGILANLLPGIGSPSQVAAFATLLIPLGTVPFLATIASIAMSEGLFSLSTAASIGKARMGATAVLSETVDINQNLAIVLVLALVSVAVTALVLFLFKKWIVKAANLDFSRFNIILALYLLAITFLIDGFWGIAVLALASAIGWLTIRIGAERTNMMGAIIVPTLLLLFGIIV